MSEKQVLSDEEKSAVQNHMLDIEALNAIIEYHKRKLMAVEVTLKKLQSICIHPKENGKSENIGDWEMITCGDCGGTPGQT